MAMIYLFTFIVTWSINVILNRPLSSWASAKDLSPGKSHFNSDAKDVSLRSTWQFYIPLSSLSTFAPHCPPSPPLCSPEPSTILLNRPLSSWTVHCHPERQRRIFTLYLSTWHMQNDISLPYYRCGIFQTRYHRSMNLKKYLEGPILWWNANGW